MKLTIFCALVLFNIHYTIAQFHVAKQGLPPYKIYNSEEYKGSPQSWDAISDDRGVMYFALSSGITEFDGQTWRHIDPLWAQCFLKVEGRIYVGGFVGFGYLDFGRNGKVEYFSLNHLLPPDSKIEVVRNIHFINGLIYFVSHEGIYIYNESNGTLSIVYSEARLFPSIVYQDQLLVKIDGKGLGKISGDSMLISPQGQYWNSIDVANILPFDNDGLITLSSESGAHYYSEDTAYQLSEFNHPYYRSNTFFNAKQLSNGYYALCFLTGSLVITDDQFQPVFLLDNQAGIDNQVHNVFEDNENNLWVTTNGGIVYINFSSKISFAKPAIGLEGSVISSLNFQDEMYVAGHAGIFYKAWGKPIDILSDDSHKFKKITNSEITGIQILETDQGLFALYTRKKGEIVNHKFTSLLDHKNTYHAAGAYVEASSLIVTSSDNGQKVEIFEVHEGEWRHYRTILDNRLPNSLIIQMTYDQRTNRFFGGTFDGEVLSFGLKEDYSALTDVIFYKESSKLPSGYKYQQKMEDGVFLGTANGLYKFDGVSKFVKDHRFGDYFNERGLKSLIKESKYVYWYVTFGEEMGRLEIQKSTNLNLVVDKKMLATLSTQNNTEHLSKTDDNQILLGTMEGLVIIDPTKNEDYTFKHTPLVRQVSLIQNGDSTIFSGIYYNRDSIASWTQQESLEIEYKENAIRFSYAVPFFKGVSEVQYRTKLQGFDESWSEWNIKTEKDYTNLPHGNYQFEIQAKNVFGVESDTTSYAFIILRPWYFSVWAYLVYLSFVFGFLWLILRLNSLRLKNENKKLELTIEERTQEVKQQSEELRELNEVKTRFFANISHEFRTPLTLIKGPIEAILSGKVTDPSSQLENLKVAQRNGNTLQKLIDELLEFNKLEHGHVIINRNPVFMLDFMSELCEGYEVLAEDNKLIWGASLSLDKNVVLSLDARKFEHILNNLISNAVKHTSERGSISLELSYNQNEIRCSVSDSGVGIEETELAHIFKRFYQASHGQQTIHSTGIGLAYVKEIIELMMGSISVSSRLDKGTTFEFVLPAKMLDNGDFEQVHDLNILVQDQSPDKYRHSNNKVLLVEDNQEMQNYIVQILSDEFELKLANNGREAIEILKSYTPDLVISDVMMPVMDGMELLRYLKTDNKLKFMSVIMLTAKSSQETRLEALALGLDDYITKPFNPLELEIRAKNILNNQFERHQWLLDNGSKEETQIEDPLILEMKSNIEQNLTSANYGVLQLAEFLAMSDRQLTRVVKKSTGLTPASFIKEIKLQSAKAFLEQRKFRTIAEVSYAIGFEKPSYFSKVYFERFGKKPSEYLA